MFSFGYPQLLILLLLLPILFGLYVLTRKARNKKLKQFGQLPVLNLQMPEVSRYTPWIKISLELLLVAVIVVILARPRAKGEASASTVNVQGSEVVVALDISNSMLASSTEDPKGISRLQRSKFLVEKLIDKFENDKVGIVVFAGDAYLQLPVTDDFSSAKLFLNSLSPSLISNQGTAIGAAIDLSMTAFSENPQCQKSIVLITDGENHEDDAVRAAKTAKEKGVEIDVVSVGTSKPMAMPLGDGTFLTDENGQAAMTACNEEMAMDIAKIGTGVYVSANNSDAVDILADQIAKAKKANMQKKIFTPNDEQFPVFAWIALALLIIDLLVSDKKISWLINTNFFGKQA